MTTLVLSVTTARAVLNKCCSCSLSIQWCPVSYLQVELMVQMPVNLLCITVLPEKPPQNTKSSHPQDLGWQTSLASTPPLTYKAQPQLQLSVCWPPGTISALYVKCNVPYPVCRPFDLASCAALARDREWIFCGFLITKPSLTSFLMFCPVPQNARKM